MSVYAQYGVGSFSGESIGVDESYVGAVGAYRMMEESAINEHNIFNRIIGVDFIEAQANHGYVSESTFEVVSEASASGIISKVIEFFKKLGEKIKGIIQNFADKLSAMFIKDGKKLVDKFKKQITAKMNQNTYDDSFKYQWCKVKNTSFFSKEPETLTKLGDAILDAKMPSNIETTLYKDKSIKDLQKLIIDYDGDTSYVFKKGDKDPKDTDMMFAVNKAAKLSDDHDGASDKLQTAYDKAENNKAHNFTKLSSDDLSDYKDAILTKLLGSKTDNSSFAKDFDELIFDDSEEVEGFDQSKRSSIETFLENNAKYESACSKAKTNVDKHIKEIVKKFEDANKTISKQMSKPGYNKVMEAVRVETSNAMSMGNTCTQCSTIYFAAIGAAIKKHYAQCRKVYIKAATYSKKAKNESAFFTAVGEVSDYEVDQMMPEF